MILSGLPYFMVQGVPSWTFSACRSYAVDRLLLGLLGALLTRAHTSYEQPPQKFYFAVSVVAGLALVVLRIVRHISATTIREL